MAEPDEVSSRYSSGTGLLDPILAFSPNLSLEEIKRRRAIAAALASRARPYPKTVGEGIASFGESLNDAVGDFTLGRAEKAYDARYGQAAGVPAPNDTLPPPASVPVTPPPPSVAPRAAVPSPAPPAPAGPMANANPLTFEPVSGPASRAAIAQTLAQLGVNRMSAGPPPGLAEDGAALPTSSTPTAGTVEDRPNPVITTSEIKPMLVAEARPRPGGPPAAPVQPPAAPGGALAPVIPESLPLPVAPERSERLTPNEQHRLNILRQFPGDPRAQFEFEQAQKLGKAARDAEYERQKAEHDVKMRAYEARETARQTAITNAPKTQLELQKEATAVTEAQAKEAYRRVHGDLPETVAKALEASKEKAQTSVAAIEAANTARQALPHAVFGAGADLKLQGYRVAAQLGNKDAQRTVEASQTFQASMGPLIQQLVKGLAGKDVSRQELEFIRSIAGGNLALDRASADTILKIAERTSNTNIKEHKETFDTLTRGQNPEAQPTLRALYGVREPGEGIPLSSPGTYTEGMTATGPDGKKMIFRKGNWESM